MANLFQQWSSQDGQPTRDQAQLAPQYQRRDSLVIVGRDLWGTPVQKFPSPSSNVARVVAGQAGTALCTDGATTAYWDVGKLSRASRGAMTWVVVFSTLGTSGPDYFAGEVDTGTSYIEDLLVNSDSSGTVSNPGSLELLLRDTSGNLRAGYTGNIGINDGRVHCVVWQVLASGDEFVCYVDGVKRSLTYPSAGTLTAQTGAMDFPLWLCTRNVRGTGGGGSDATQKIYLFARIPTMVPNAERLSVDPWSLFEPIEQPFFISTVGGSFNASWNVAANSVIQPGAMVA